MTDAQANSASNMFNCMFQFFEGFPLFGSFVAINVFEMNTEIMQQAVIASTLLLPLSNEEKPEVYPVSSHLALLK